MKGLFVKKHGKNIKISNIIKNGIFSKYINRKSQSLKRLLTKEEKTIKGYIEMGKINLSYSELGCAENTIDLEKYEVWISECDLQSDDNYKTG